jgi:hypothetical protein
MLSLDPGDPSVAVMDAPTRRAMSRKVLIE